MESGWEMPGRRANAAGCQWIVPITRITMNNWTTRSIETNRAVAVLLLAGSLACGACSSSKGDQAGAGEAMRSGGRAGPSGQTGQSGQTSQAGQGSRGPVSVATQLSDAQLREQCIGILTTALGASQPEQVGNAIEGLLQAPARLEPSLARLLTNESPAVRAIAAKAIARGKLANAAESTRPLLTDPVSIVRSAAIFALAANGLKVDPTPLATMLKTGQPRERAEAAYILGELGNTSAVTLLRDGASTPMPRADAVEARLAYLQMAEAMVKLGEDSAINEVRAALYPARPEDLEATVLAAQIIGQVKDKQSAAQLIYLTADKDPMGNPYPAEVRLQIAGSLAKLGNSRGVYIADEFAKSAKPVLRAQAVSVYGETRQREFLAKATAMINDPDGIVRIYAATAVLKILEAAR